VDHLLPLVEDESARMRSIAAQALADVPTERALPALVAVLDDENSNVRGNAVRALSAIGTKEVLEPLYRMIDDEEEWIRIAALRGLAALGLEQIIGQTAPLLESDSWRTRGTGVEILGLLSSERGLPLVVERLNDEEPWVRRNAVIAILQIGSPSARGALSRMTDDDDWEVRVYAVEALRRLQEQTP
jgi:HEAT repeat protein